MRFKMAALIAATLGIFGTLTTTLTPEARAVERTWQARAASEPSVRSSPSPAMGAGAVAERRVRAQVFRCDLFSHICVKFTRSQTRAVANLAGPGLIGAASWATHVCGRLPSGAGVVGCTILVSVYAYLLDRSFTSAAARDRCVELHFPFVPFGGAFWWKTEKC